MSQEPTTAGAVEEGRALAAPLVIVLGDAAELTRGSDQNSVESKQNPYD
ncbi:albusnodin family lasso peptide [Streptomyces sp. JNUCC 64]